MSCSNYRCIELTNNNIGAVAINGYMPLGNITRRISTKTGSGVPFEVTTSGADTLLLTDKGYYDFLYSASLVVGGAGTLTVTLLENGTAIASATETAAGAGAINITLPKMVRVFANCPSVPNNCPALLQVQLSGLAVTGGNSVLRVDSCVNG